MANLIRYIVCLIFLTTANTYAADATVDDIIHHMDMLYRSQTSYAELEMEIVTPNWQRTLKMKMWTQGLNKTFITLTEPKKDAGISTLRDGTEMWNYFPKINKVMKVPPSMMMGSWMGSDFTNDDLVKETSLSKDYDAKLVPPEAENTCVLELIPKAETATVWGKIVLTVRTSDLLPLREVYYDERGTLMRVIEFGDITTFGGRTLPAVMELVPKSKEGHKTVIRYLDAAFDQKLGDDVFSLRNLRQRR